MILVLLMSCYLTYTSGVAHNSEGTTLGTRFYLFGPDPYYNMRIVTEASSTGLYPFINTNDPLLNYPNGGTGSRPPLFNMIALSTAGLLDNFMESTDALGWSMLFLPAIYGALLVLPIYGIGKELFNRKVGLLSAILLPIIPTFVGGSHGATFSLFDHDSFLLLLFVLTFYFLIKAIKEQNQKKTLLFATLAGITIGAVELTWVVSQILPIMLLIFLICLLFVGMIQNKYHIRVAYLIHYAFFVGYLISYPYRFVTNNTDSYLFLIILVSFVLLTTFYIFDLKKPKKIVSVPLFISGGIACLGFLKLVNMGIIDIKGEIYDLSNILFGTGIYGSKIHITIGEGQVFPLIYTGLSLGLFVFWLGLAGFILYMMKTYNEKFKPEYLLFLIYSLISFVMIAFAVRFVIFFVPMMVIFTGFLLWRIIDKNQKAKWLGVTMILFMVVVPNGYFAYDSVSNLDLDTSYRWSDACYWLSQQDTELAPEDRPGVMSWCDYGFYIVSMGEHPTVADNFQHGIYPAGNFLTAQSEEEALSVLIIRLIENNISNETETVLYDYLGNDTKLIEIIREPTKAPSYDMLIAPEYDNTVMRKNKFNAMYHDGTDILMELSKSKLFDLYYAVSESTQNHIKYVAIDERDLVDIFVPIAFLADKSVYGYVISEDDWFVLEDDKTVEKELYYKSMGYRMFYDYESLEFWNVVYNESNIVFLELVNIG
jgi:dolichyl-phosphooligosaccharide-protein glycotransferase